MCCAPTDSAMARRGCGRATAGASSSTCAWCREAVEAQIRWILPRLEVVQGQRLACGRQLRSSSSSSGIVPMTRRNAASIATSPFSNPAGSRNKKSLSRCSLKRPNHSRTATMTDCVPTWARRPSPARAANAGWCRCAARAIASSAGRRTRLGAGQRAARCRQCRVLPPVARVAIDMAAPSQCR